MKSLKKLEIELNGLRSNPTIFEEKCNKFPELKETHAFTSGLIATMMNVINHLNPKMPAIVVNEVDHETVLTASKDMVMVQAKKVCDKITDECVILDSSGSFCQIICPDCDSATKISSSTNKRTGKISFSVHNFSRHYETHTEQTAKQDKSASQIDLGESSKNSRIQILERDLENLRVDNGEHLTTIQSKDKLITELNGKIFNLMEQLKEFAIDGENTKNCKVLIVSSCFFVLSKLFYSTNRNA
ncbi:uncharacterized protein LOC129571981 [Sitodiplosis mosellana]|uniref:uncharacterized protein LOC129571981 n=1 Tax=Sitodiplosis mosellana TaxID=263140 RepID=UPI002443F388|nr:uncharacterized protein LOC129571981 [Sitodiplosis mosellana]